MIKEGSKVKVHYTGKFEDDKVFDTSNNKEPLEVEVGTGKLIPGFENGLIGLEEGDKKTIELDPNQAYGDFNKELINEIDVKRLPENIQPGQVLQANTPNGPMNVTVVEVNEKTAKLDANHPLAGRKLIFDLEVVEVM